MKKATYNENGYEIMEFELNQIESAVVCGAVGITAGLAVYGGIVLVKNLMSKTDDGENEEEEE